MNDLMTKSFLNYVELKKQAQKDLKDEQQDIEIGRFNKPGHEENLSLFFQEVEAIKSEMEGIKNLLLDLQNLNEETKSTHSAKVLRGLRDQMESNTVSILRKANIIKAKLEALDRSNIENRRILFQYREGSAVDRTRISVTNGLRVKLREMMSDFHSLRQRILSGHKEDLKRRYFMATGNEPTEEVMSKMVSGSLRVQVFEEKNDLNSETNARHEAVMDIQKSLIRLHQVFLDMAVIVDAQGEKLEEIELNVEDASMGISGGTNSLYYANQMKKGGKKWVFWVLIIVTIILLIRPCEEGVRQNSRPQHFHLEHHDKRILKQGIPRRSTVSLPSNAMLFSSTQSLHFPFPAQGMFSLSALEETQQIHTHRSITDIVSGNLMIDWYLKCGEMDLATEIFKQMPTKNVISGTTMFQYGDVEEAVKIFEKMKKGVPVWTPMIVGLAIHSRAREAFNLFVEMQEEGIKPNPIPFTGILTACSRGGFLQEEKVLIEKMAMKPNAARCEKLAITFGLISTEPGMTLPIVNNLRVCRDCHTATKLISKVYARIIVLQDRNRFRHFENGNCSCEDYR
ncbi:Syntaxin, N-terminal domain [Dillenia turbinata]|uniref:Syntaxin, N-terminal domain n=1 Tax=Dillenia turbinata TaxID=194707 RepID=A0AAN8V6F6_9MAGN